MLSIPFSCRSRKRNTNRFFYKQRITSRFYHLVRLLLLNSSKNLFDGLPSTTFTRWQKLETEIDIVILCDVKRKRGTAIPSFMGHTYECVFIWFTLGFFFFECKTFQTCSLKIKSKNVVLYAGNPFYFPQQCLQSSLVYGQSERIHLLSRYSTLYEFRENFYEIKWKDFLDLVGLFLWHNFQPVMDTSRS